MVLQTQRDFLHKKKKSEILLSVFISADFRGLLLRCIVGGIGNVIMVKHLHARRLNAL